DSLTIFHHQYLMAQLVKLILIKGGEEKYKQYKFYNFSALKRQTKISRNGLHYYSTRVTLVFSCPDQGFIDYFLKNLFDFPQIEVGNLVLIPEAVEREEYRSEERRVGKEEREQSTRES